MKLLEKRTAGVAEDAPPLDCALDALKVRLKTWEATESGFQ